MSAIEATRLTIPEHIDTSGCVDLRRLSRAALRWTAQPDYNLGAWLRQSTVS